MDKINNFYMGFLRNLLFYWQAGFYKQSLFSPSRGKYLYNVDNLKKKMKIDKFKCVRCGLCEEIEDDDELIEKCPMGAVSKD